MPADPPEPEGGADQGTPAVQGDAGGPVEEGRAPADPAALQLQVAPDANATLVTRSKAKPKRAAQLDMPFLNSLLLLLLLLLLLPQVVDEEALCRSGCPDAGPNATEASEASVNSSTGGGAGAEATSLGFGSEDAERSNQLDVLDPVTKIPAWGAQYVKGAQPPFKATSMEELTQLIQLITQLTTGQHPNHLGLKHRAALDAYFTREIFKKLPGWQLAVLVAYLSRRHKATPSRWPKLDAELKRRKCKIPMKAVQGNLAVVPARSSQRIRNRAPTAAAGAAGATGAAGAGASAGAEGGLQIVRTNKRKPNGARRNDDGPTMFESLDDVEQHARDLQQVADATTVASSHLALMEFHLKHIVTQLTNEIDKLRQHKADLEQQVASLTAEVAAKERTLAQG